MNKIKVPLHNTTKDFLLILILNFQIKIAIKYIKAVL